MPCLKWGQKVCKNQKLGGTVINHYLLDMTCSYTRELSSAVLGCTTFVQGQASQYSSKLGERILKSRNPKCLGFLLAYFILFLHVALADLEHVMQFRLTSNLWQSSYLCLPSMVITDMNNHARLVCLSLVSGLIEVSG